MSLYCTLLCKGYHIPEKILQIINFGHLFILQFWTSFPSTTGQLIPLKMNALKAVLLWNHQTRENWCLNTKVDREVIFLTSNLLCGSFVPLFNKRKRRGEESLFNQCCTRIFLPTDADIRTDVFLAVAPCWGSGSSSWRGLQPIPNSALGSPLHPHQRDMPFPWLWASDWSN